MKNTSICKTLFKIWFFLGWVQLNGLEDINPIYDPVIAGHGAQVVKLYDPRNNSLINCTLIDKVSQKKPKILIKLFDKYSVTPIQWGTRYNFFGGFAYNLGGWGSRGLNMWMKIRIQCNMQYLTIISILFWADFWGKKVVNVPQRVLNWQRVTFQGDVW